LLAFCTGSFWGVAAIAFPIIIPLAQTLDVNVLLASGAVISGAVFGSHTCFYSDAATLTCVATQIKNSDYARVVLPVIAVPFGLGIIAFLVAGIAMA
ncbi:MAG: sodium:proton antiporter, partial [Clostridiales Family XIII bacterium]|jgi:Na+/H+ antiporter NhaC|nr:sodium:proton antiporter [Clostridiales Family XIII bacterium]